MNTAVDKQSLASTMDALGRAAESDELRSQARAILRKISEGTD